jgi:hypothetical protein
VGKIRGTVIFVSGGHCSGRDGVCVTMEATSNVGVVDGVGLGVADGRGVVAAIETLSGGLLVVVKVGLAGGELTGLGDGRSSPCGLQAVIIKNIRMQIVCFMVFLKAAYCLYGNNLLALTSATASGR